MDSQNSWGIRKCANTEISELPGTTDIQFVTVVQNLFYKKETLLLEVSTDFGEKNNDKYILFL